ncbi:SAM-dependent methyltransferase [Rubrobacter marinus]|uniref:SAM-dependent methyltransferase n=1 Tax=Rubrobacter marinus TaxID=2653852 RepID=UPI001407E08E|nr:methyltransferase domain-containing protein [Rubrobacter marinus]
MSGRGSSAVNTARDYYNSPDADRFYSTVWGGEDIHVGLYESPDEPIFTASRRTVERMAASLPTLGPDSRVLDMGSGYGGSARYLANAAGCRVVALNLSEVENERARELNREKGLSGLVEVVDGSFEAIPFGDEHFDVVWSQDAILHSGERETVLREVARVLKPGGRFTFTDPMQSDDCPDGVLQPILDRIHLGSLGSPGFYRRAAGEAGLKEVDFEDHSGQLPTHYARVLEETEKREDELLRSVDEGYIRRMKKGLRHWVDGGNNGYLAWGIFRFDAP